MRPETIAIRAGFESGSTAHAVAVLEQRVAELECGTAALATASGQAALHCAFSNIADGGGNIVTTPQLCGTTHTLLAHVLPKAGITGRFAADDSAEAMAAQIDGNTRALFCESVGDPAGNICDIEAIARVAHTHGVPLIVDNTVATPILMRPLELGADIVVHSLTRFMGSHGAAMGGILVESGCFDWKRHADRFPQFTTPDGSGHGPVYADRFPLYPFIARAHSMLAHTTGAILPPRNALPLLQGIETMALRVERHVANAQAVAEFLKSHPGVAWVEYAGLEQSRYHALARKYFHGKAPPLLTFGIKGGYEAGKRFHDALMPIARLVNIGDAKTLACHPASTTHRQMMPAEQRCAGITPETIRLSVGIEYKDDIIADMAQALDAARTVGLLQVAE